MISRVQHEAIRFRHPPHGILSILARGAWQMLILMAMIACLQARPQFLGIAAGGASPARTSNSLLPLTSAEVIEPQLRVDIFTVSETLAAPLATDVRPELCRKKAGPGWRSVWLKH